MPAELDARSAALRAVALAQGRQMILDLGRSIVGRFLGYAIACGLLFALSIGGLALYQSTQDGVEAVVRIINAAAGPRLPVLEEAIRQEDPDRVRLLLGEILEEEDLILAQVTAEGQVRWSRGTRTDRCEIIRSFPLAPSYPHGAEPIGTLEVVGSLDRIHHQLVNRMLLLLTVSGLLIAAMCLLIVHVTRRGVVRHLDSIARHVRDLGFSGSLRPLILDRWYDRGADELETVVAEINAMQERGIREYSRLREEEKRLRQFFEAAGEGIFSVNAEGICTFMNDRCLTAFGLDAKASPLGRAIQDLLPATAPVDKEGSVFIELILRTLVSREPVRATEAGIALADGRRIAISVRSYPLFEGERCVGVIVFFSDLSTLHLLEFERRLHEKVIQQIPVAIVFLDDRGRVQSVNPSFEQMLGYSTEELRGRRPFFCWHDLHDPEQYRKIVASLRQGRQWQGILVNTGKNGRPVTMETLVMPIRELDGSIVSFIAFARDRSREQELQQQLHHAQKMEAIGTLAASIAHEFGNPLLGIRFAIRDVRRLNSLEERDHKLLQLAEEECDRMKSLIRDLQSFSRPTSGRKTRFSLNELLDNILLFQHKLFESRSVRLECRFAEEDIQMDGIQDQLRQVFVNLLINACEAMPPAGGVVVVGARRIGDMVEVRVEDNGGGIEPEALEHIFEPFFTTKGEVEGIGLGLPVSYGIVHAHGGSILVESEPGRGAVFTVQLPGGEEGGQPLG